MSKVQITAFTGEYYFLSNYCACPITIDGLTYRSAEAAFQAAKCNVPIDRAVFCTVPPNVAYVWAQLHAGRKELCVWASEIEEFPIAVTKKWFPEVEDGKLF